MRLCLVLMCLSLFLMPGCSASANRGSGVSEVTPLIGSWVLVSIDGEDVSALLPEGADAPTLTIAENMRLTGMSGVNQYMGEVDDEELTGGTFYTGPLAVTRKAGAAELM